MTEFSLSDNPHRRLNPLTGEWVLNSPHRNQRPWQGKQESAAIAKRPPYDPGCYLCPGNKRASGQVNPQYKETYLFTNDFSALQNLSLTKPKSSHPLLQLDVPQGTCQVVCFSPYHNLTLAEMSIPAIEGVVQVWADQIADLGSRYRWVQIFENKGEMMGCSNPHPHCQIWASSSLPTEAEKEDRNQLTYLINHGSNLLFDYYQLEIEQETRIVVKNDHWMAVTPFWSLWPFETLLLPKRPVLRLPDLNRTERAALASVLKSLLLKYDRLFDVSFPYSMGWHGAPNDKQDYSHWMLHAHFYPPLLRSATVRKFLVGYETLAEPQRDLTPEQAAEQLRAL